MAQLPDARPGTPPARDSGQEPPGGDAGCGAPAAQRPKTGQPSRQWISRAVRSPTMVTLRKFTLRTSHQGDRWQICSYRDDGLGGTEPTPVLCGPVLGRPNGPPSPVSTGPAWIKSREQLWQPPADINWEDHVGALEGSGTLLYPDMPQETDGGPLGEIRQGWPTRRPRRVARCPRRRAECRPIALRRCNSPWIPAPQ